MIVNDWHSFECLLRKRRIFPVSEGFDEGNARNSRMTCTRMTPVVEERDGGMTARVPAKLPRRVGLAQVGSAHSHT